MQSTFVLPPASLTPASIRRAIPPHLFLRSTLKSTAYIARHILIGVLFYALACRIPVGWSLSVRVMLWTMYGAWQGFVFAGIWCLGHEAGHDALSPHRLVNTVLGLSLHTFVLTPYFAWRATHRAHHKGTNHLDRDETYLRGSPDQSCCPDVCTPDSSSIPRGPGLAPGFDCASRRLHGRIRRYPSIHAVQARREAVPTHPHPQEDSSFTYCALILALLSPHPLTDTRSHNRKGNRKYPPCTSVSLQSQLGTVPLLSTPVDPRVRCRGARYARSSLPFRVPGRDWCPGKTIHPSVAGELIRLRNSAAINLIRSLRIIGVSPRIFDDEDGVNELWMGRIVTVTYLQHASPAVPYYRSPAWTFTRGSLATVDRPLFGWVGRFFLHHIGSDHVAHHFFSGIPFYNLPEVTRAIRPVLGEHYRYDETPALIALWTTFTQCKFVEDEGDVLFFKNAEGRNAVEEIMQ
ncbi:unnamed protein product [Mycena citricolor]|uniref:Fatty acid desaturase domain-containing protein n=1 Tax=Mycena citricolor TaxID=2018698 RepID=A0AAD2GYI0_9AGAR|nr:unnamed protein product [Mycena citricolor]